MKSDLIEQKLPFEIKSNTDDELIFEKLKEAELEMKNTKERYTTDEIIDSMKKLIG